MNPGAVAGAASPRLPAVAARPGAGSRATASSRTMARIHRPAAPRMTASPSAALPFASAPSPGAAAAPRGRAAPPACEPVVVTHRFDTLEAELLRGCLEAHGIPTTLGDVRTIQTDTLWTVALGGVRVMVPEPAAEDARRLVAQFDRGELAVDEPPLDAEAAPADAAVEDAPPHAPSGRALRWTAALLGLALLLGAAAPLAGACLP